MFDHDLFTWEIRGGKFVLVEEQSKFSDYVKETIETFNKSLDDSLKMEFLDFVYEVSKNLDTNYVSEANENFIKNFKIFLKEYRNTSPDKKDDWKSIAKNLGKASIRNRDLLLPRILDRK